MRAPGRPAQHEQPPEDEEERDHSEDEARDLLRPVDRVCEPRVGSDGQQTPWLGIDEGAEQLPAERDREGTGDQQLGRAGPGAPLRKGQHEQSQRGDPQLLEQSTERPECARARPLEIRGQNGKAGCEE